MEALNLISLAMDTRKRIFIRLIHLRGALPTLAVALPLRVPQRLASPRLPSLATAPGYTGGVGAGARLRAPAGRGPPLALTLSCLALPTLAVALAGAGRARP